LKTRVAEGSICLPSMEHSAHRVPNSPNEIDSAESRWKYWKNTEVVNLIPAFSIDRSRFELVNERPDRVTADQIFPMGRGLPLRIIQRNNVIDRDADGGNLLAKAPSGDPQNAGRLRLIAVGLS